MSETNMTLNKKSDKKRSEKLRQYKTKKEKLRQYKKKKEVRKAEAVT